MPTATQLNLTMENHVGTLARLCRDLAHGGVNVLAISAPEAQREKGVVRLLVPNRELATHVLSQAGYRFAAEEVLFVELTNRPGALARAVEKLARANIDIRYAYATARTRRRRGPFRNGRTSTSATLMPPPPAARGRRRPSSPCRKGRWSAQCSCWGSRQLKRASGRFFQDRPASARNLADS